jgi:hypothetical protein
MSATNMLISPSKASQCLHLRKVCSFFPLLICSIFLRSSKALLLVVITCCKPCVVWALTKSWLVFPSTTILSIITHYKLIKLPVIRNELTSNQICVPEGAMYYMLSRPRGMRTGKYRQRIKGWQVPCKTILELPAVLLPNTSNPCYSPRWVTHPSSRRYSRAWHCINVVPKLELSFASLGDGNRSAHFPHSIIL